MATAVEAATAAGVQGDLMTRRDEFTNHAQSWRRAAVGAGAALVVTLGPRPAGRPTRARRRCRRRVRRAPGEATLVGWLRESASYDPRFAFVAFDGDRIVGHVMATWGDLDGAPTFPLGPLSVEPSRQGQGIGSRLMEATLDAARQAGASVVVLLGEPGYYARFGFVRAADLGISADRHGVSSSRRVLSRAAGGATVTLKARRAPDRAASSPTLSRSRAWGDGRRTPSSRLSGAHEGGQPMRRPASRVRERREAPEA
ncbi:GNAT family N-acetyltransferase [Dermacoccus sp. BD5]